MCIFLQTWTLFSEIRCHLWKCDTNQIKHRYFQIPFLSTSCFQQLQLSDLLGELGLGVGEHLWRRMFTFLLLMEQFPWSVLQWFGWSWGEKSERCSWHTRPQLLCGSIGSSAFSHIVSFHLQTPLRWRGNWGLERLDNLREASDEGRVQMVTEAAEPELLTP